MEWSSFNCQKLDTNNQINKIMYTTHCLICNTAVKSSRKRKYCGKQCQSIAYYRSHPDRIKFNISTEWKSDRRKQIFVNDKFFDWKQYPEGVLI